MATKATEMAEKFLKGEACFDDLNEACRRMTLI